MRNIELLTDTVPIIYVQSLYCFSFKNAKNADLEYIFIKADVDLIKIIIKMLLYHQLNNNASRLRNNAQVL